MVDQIGAGDRALVLITPLLIHHPFNELDSLEVIEKHQTLLPAGRGAERSPTRIGFLAGPAQGAVAGIKGILNRYGTTVDLQIAITAAGIEP